MVSVSSPALFDSRIKYAVLTPKILILSERTKITDSGAQKDRTDKTLNKGQKTDSDDVVCSMCVFVWCTEVHIQECVEVCVMMGIVTQYPLGTKAVQQRDKEQ